MPEVLIINEPKLPNFNTRVSGMNTRVYIIALHSFNFYAMNVVLETGPWKLSIVYTQDPANLG